MTGQDFAPRQSRTRAVPWRAFSRPLCFSVGLLLNKTFTEVVPASGGGRVGNKSQRAAFAWIKDAADTPTFFLGHNRHSARRGQIVIRVDDPFTQMLIKACGPAHQRRSARMLIRIHGRLRKLWENALKSQLAESLADYPLDILSITFFGGEREIPTVQIRYYCTQDEQKTHCFAWKSCYQGPMP